MTRPICAHCGKPYGRRNTKTETVHYHVGAKPAYVGNAVVLREHQHRQTMTREAVEQLRAKPLTDWQKRNPPDWSKPDYVCDLVTMHRETWDGVSYLGGYDPFCTLRCALEYARKMWKAKQ